MVETAGQSLPIENQQEEFNLLLEACYFRQTKDGNKALFSAEEVKDYYQRKGYAPIGAALAGIVAEKIHAAVWPENLKDQGLDKEKATIPDDVRDLVSACRYVEGVLVQELADQYDRPTTRLTSYAVPLSNRLSELALERYLQIPPPRNGRALPYIVCERTSGDEGRVTAFLKSGEVVSVSIDVSNLGGLNNVLSSSSPNSKRSRELPNAVMDIFFDLVEQQTLQWANTQDADPPKNQEQAAEHIEQLNKDCTIFASDLFEKGEEIASALGVNFIETTKPDEEDGQLKMGAGIAVSVKRLDRNEPLPQQLEEQRDDDIQTTKKKLRKPTNQYQVWRRPRPPRSDDGARQPTGLQRLFPQRKTQNTHKFFDTSINFLRYRWAAHNALFQTPVLNGLSLLHLCESVKEPLKELLKPLPLNIFRKEKIPLEPTKQYFSYEQGAAASGLLPRTVAKFAVMKEVLTKAVSRLSTAIDNEPITNLIDDHLARRYEGIGNPRQLVEEVIVSAEDAALKQPGGYFAREAADDLVAQDNELWTLNIPKGAALNKYLTEDVTDRVLNYFKQRFQIHVRNELHELRTREPVRYKNSAVSFFRDQGVFGFHAEPHDIDAEARQIVLSAAIKKLNEDAIGLGLQHLPNSRSTDSVGFPIGIKALAIPANAHLTKADAAALIAENCKLQPTDDNAYIAAGTPDANADQWEETVSPEAVKNIVKNALSPKLLDTSELLEPAEERGIPAGLEPLDESDIRFAATAEKAAAQLKGKKIVIIEMDRNGKISQKPPPANNIVGFMRSAFMARLAGR
ncbi:MAG: hypothetical protein LW855_05010 [Alphaproteobacteria bacterium]|nr:hypothetical protein [Alphaproteobacteria bacterium]